jgi:cytidylate kinase
MTAKRCSHAVIAIDGPSGVGKSTIGKRLAQILGYVYVDSGAMYRAIGWAVMAEGLPLDVPAGIVALLHRTRLEVTFQQGQSEVWVNGQSTTSRLHGEAVGAAASAVAMVPAVRQVITARLRRLRCQADLVMEGRDIGTVVFPDATVKFFLDASIERRGQRRFRDLQAAGQVATLEHVTQAVAARDAQDRSRSVSPLLPAVEARMIDTTDLTIDEVVQLMLSEIYPQILQGDE